MTTPTQNYPTALELNRALERGRAERARAFHTGLRAIGSFLKGGKTQIRH